MDHPPYPKPSCDDRNPKAVLQGTHTQPGRAHPGSFELAVCIITDIPNRVTNYDLYQIPFNANSNCGSVKAWAPRLYTVPSPGYISRPVTFIPPTLTALVLPNYLVCSVGGKCITTSTERYILHRSKNYISSIGQNNISKG